MISLGHNGLIGYRCILFINSELFLFHRNILDEIKRNPRSAGTGAAGGFAGEQTLIELRNSMNGVQQDLKNIMANKSVSHL